MENQVYTALGLMSGTSLDGIDVAVIKTDGRSIFGFGPVYAWKYSSTIRQELEAQIQVALDWGFEGPRPVILESGEMILDSEHANAVFALSNDPAVNLSEIGVIGYHGQTVLHHPQHEDQTGQTLQLGNGQNLADMIGVGVVYDFRSNDVSEGGQGAPLAPIYHQALVNYSNVTGRVIVLNLGGVANISAIEDGRLVWATDCGPANGPLDSWVQSHKAGDYDKKGALSFKGDVDHKLINQWLKHDFFNRQIPRSADRYDFDVLADMSHMSLEDGAATLASFCAQSVARDVKAFQADHVIACGGGRKNKAIMAMLGLHLDADILTAEDFDWDGDMLEAQAFAYLAVRTVNGLPNSFPSTTGAPRPIIGGQLAYPSKSGRSLGGE